MFTDFRLISIVKNSNLRLKKASLSTFARPCHSFSLSLTSNKIYHSLRTGIPKCSLSISISLILYSHCRSPSKRNEHKVRKGCVKSQFANGFKESHLVLYSWEILLVCHSYLEKLSLDLLCKHLPFLPL